MRVISWFLATVFVLLLGIFLIGERKVNTHDTTIQEAAEFQMEPVFADMMADVIMYESAANNEFPPAVYLYAENLLSTERSEDRTIQSRMSASNDFQQDMERSEDRTIYLMVAGTRDYFMTTFADKRGTHPIKGPLRGRFQMVMNGLDHRLGSST